ncbi:MAG: hypothetical protein L6416_12510, partial [Candidatus Omnitrophica bacterium]|nr:hypothetical protein [Candidatus Omnitrophota bacterium]
NIRLKVQPLINHYPVREFQIDFPIINLFILLEHRFFINIAVMSRSNGDTGLSVKAFSGNSRKNHSCADIFIYPVNTLIRKTDTAKRAESSGGIILS